MTKLTPNEPIKQKKRNKTIFLVKLVAMLAIWVTAWFLLQGELYQQFFANTFSVSTAFILFIFVSFVSSGAFMVIFLVALVKHEHIQDFRSAFKIERLDTKGIWLGFGLVIFINVLNITLFSLFLVPIRYFLISIGLTGGAIGFASSNIVPLLSPMEAILLTVFLLVFWWLEVPEELFFRGYIQNNLQKYTGKKTSTFLSALIWDISHIFNLASVVERFFSGLALSYLFEKRQNTTPSMIVHPVGNRALLLAVVIPQIWGLALDPTRSPLTILALDLAIYAALLVAIIVGWKLLKLDIPKVVA
jgi:membrane protease YdiL (CAAX protease family)